MSGGAGGIASSSPYGVTGEGLPFADPRDPRRNISWPKPPAGTSDAGPAVIYTGPGARHGYTRGSHRRHRAPAIMIHLPEEAPRYFNQLGQIRKGDRRRPDNFGVRGWRTHRLDTVQVNPVLEHPRIVAPSLFAPIIRWGVRQWNWSGMSATPRFQERFVIVGRLVEQVQDRKRMAGAEGRTAGGGYTYVYPQFMTGSRAVVLTSPPAARGPLAPGGARG